MKDKRNETKSERNNEHNEAVESGQQTRKLFRKQKQKKQEATEEQAHKKVRWVQIRLIPIWLRVIIVALLVVGFAVLGAYVGYSVIGDGEPSEIFEKETWNHIVDIIKGVE